MVKTCKCGCGRIVKGTWVRGHSKKMEGNHNWKGGIKYRKDGYVEIKLPGHPRAKHKNYVFQHVIIIERFLGRYLELDEVAHHCNGIKNDNRIENLELMLISHHKRYHNLHMPEKSRKKMSESAKKRVRDCHGRFIKGGCNHESK